MTENLVFYGVSLPTYVWEPLKNAYTYHNFVYGSCRLPLANYLIPEACSIFPLSHFVFFVLVSLGRLCSHPLGIITSRLDPLPGAQQHS